MENTYNHCDAQLMSDFCSSAAFHLSFTPLVRCQLSLVPAVCPNLMTILENTKEITVTITHQCRPWTLELPFCRTNFSIYRGNFKESFKIGMELVTKWTPFLQTNILWVKVLSALTDCFLFCSFDSLCLKVELSADSEWDGSRGVCDMCVIFCNFTWFLSQNLNDKYIQLSETCAVNHPKDVAPTGWACSQGNVLKQ